MFGKKLKELRQEKHIHSPDIAKEIGLHQTTVWYFENRDPESIDLYLSFLAKNGVDLNKAFASESDNIARYLKKERQELKISWQEITNSIGISQSSLSYLENRGDTPFIKYLKYLVQKDVDLNQVFG
jgi:transcriptional regulator with XRE-family HTH domain